MPIPQLELIPQSLIACLEVRKRRGSKVKGGGGRVIQLPCLEVFLKKEGEGFGGVSTSSNPSFLISPNWRDLERE